MKISRTFRRAYQYLVSVFILTLLAAQAATLVPQVLKGNSPDARFWPILSYDMYAKPRQDGDTVEVNYLLEATTTGGRKLSIDKDRLGLDYWNYVKWTRGLVRGDVEDVATLRVLLQKVYPDEAFREVRVLSFPLKVTVTGGVPAESKVIHQVLLTE